MLTDGTVPENQGNALVGRLIVSDPDRTGQTFTMSVQDQNSPFKVFGTALKTTRPLNFEQQYQYKVTVKAIDQGGKFLFQLKYIYRKSFKTPRLL